LLKIEVFDGFFNVRVKSIGDSALKLSQPSCLPHGASSHQGKKDAYIIVRQLEMMFEKD
jgi:hypothetical protein